STPAPRCTSFPNRTGCPPRARKPVAAPPAERLSDRPRSARRPPARLLPGGAAAIQSRLERPGRGQLRRVRVQQAPQRELRRRPGTDAVPALDLAQVRARRRRARPARRDPRRGQLPARERRSAELPARPLPLQPFPALRRRRSPLREQDPLRPAGVLRLLQPAGLRPHAARARPSHRAALTRLEGLQQLWDAPPPT